MSGRSLDPRRRRRSPSRKSSRASHRFLRCEWLEPRTLLSGNSLSSLVIGGCSSAVTVGAHAPVNTAPIVASPISLSGYAAVTGKTASFSVLGSDDGGESKLVYTWSVTAAPAGGMATFNINGANSAKNITATFTKAGTYGFTVRIVDAERSLGKQHQERGGLSHTDEHQRQHCQRPGRQCRLSLGRLGRQPIDRCPRLGSIRLRLGHAAYFHLVDPHGAQWRIEAGFGHARRSRYGNIWQGRDLRTGSPRQNHGRYFGHSQRVDDVGAGAERRQECVDRGGECLGDQRATGPADVRRPVRQRDECGACA